MDGRCSLQKNEKGKRIQKEAKKKMMSVFFNFSPHHLIKKEGKKGKGGEDVKVLLKTSL